MADEIDAATTDPIPKVTRDDPAAHSGDVVADNVAALKAMFPAIVTDGKVDFDVLRQLLGDTVEDGVERYGLNWKGKARARAFALTPSLGTLRPAKADSKDWDTTRNIVIEGDNLEVLKLLRKSYAGKVKLIYIDPPYNTGGDFIYPDNYVDSIANYEALTGQRAHDGAILTTNKDSSGRFHTDWLNFMFPRLMLAKELMRDDGVIFVSISDNQVGNLRALCDTVFGYDNLIATICHKARASVSNDKIVSGSHNFILLFARSRAVVEGLRAQFGLEPVLEGFDRKDEHGDYKFTPVDGPGGAAKGNPYYTFQGVTGYFRYSEAEMKKRWDEGRVVKVGNGLQQKYYRHDAERTRKTDTTWWDHSFYTSTATAQLKDLMGAEVFSNPKHLSLITRMLELWPREPGDVVLDFFAGSGTTGHAVVAQNAADGGNRRYILVQLPEPLDPAKAEQKAAADFCDKLGKPRTIAELTKERLRRAGEKVKADHPRAQLDTGFRVYKLATSNLKPWQPGDDLAADLLDAADNLLPGRSEDDLLVELLLKTGIDLTLTSQTRTVTQRTVHAFGGGTLIVCLADVPAHAASALGEGIAAWLEELTPPGGRTTFFFRDTGFDAGSETKGDRAAEAKANLAATLRQRLGDGAIEKLGAI